MKALRPGGLPVGLNPVGLCRTDDHRYYYNGEGPFTSVTTIIDVLDKSGPLVGWAKRVTAEAAIDNRGKLQEWMEVGGRDGAVGLLTRAASAIRDRAKDAGSEVHQIAEAISRGQAVTIADELQPYVAAYRKWRDEWEPRFLAAEEMVVSVQHHYAGTFDAIVEIAGETWMVDYKTSKGVYPETGLQLAAYSNADFIGRPGISRRFRIPDIDQHAVLHLRPEGYEFVPFDVRDVDFEAFLHAASLRQWREGRASRIVQQPVGPSIYALTKGITA